MPIRVLVVEDSLTVRKYIVGQLSEDPEIEVVGEAEDGKRAIDLCTKLRPDVITLDIVLPVMTGAAVAEYIMAYQPTPILIVSSSTQRGELFKTYDALAAGALDVFEKLKAVGGEEWGNNLRRKVKLISRIKVITHPRAKQRMRATRRALAVDLAANNDGNREVVAIGASTGGPAALIELFRGLPRDFPLPILLVIHLSPLFAGSFVDWLSRESGVRVRYAEDQARLPNHSDLRETTVIMAPPDRHLVVEYPNQIRLSGDAPRQSCRPSVDVLFESVAQVFGGRAIACLLTGMGRDGAQGLLNARRAGVKTFAQDEESSFIFGMPGEAVRIGAAERILPLSDFAPTLVSLTRQGVS